MMTHDGEKGRHWDYDDGGRGTGSWDPLHSESSRRYKPRSERKDERCSAQADNAEQVAPSAAEETSMPTEVRLRLNRIKAEEAIRGGGLPPEEQDAAIDALRERYREAVTALSRSGVAGLGR